MKLTKLLILCLLLSLSAHSKTIVIPVPPTFGNPGPITICINGSYFLNPSTTNGTFSTLSATIATVNSSGYVTGVSEGTTTVSLVTEGGTVTATVTVAATSTLPAITDGLASYKFNNNPQGPIGSGNVNYMGYNGFNYSSTTRPINTGYYRANNVSGSSAGSPTEFYIFRCTSCGTVSEYATRPQGTLSGNTNGTGQLTYTSSNGGGPFTIVYQAIGASPVTVNNISSTVAFNVVTPTITTSYKLISVTDEITKATTDFSGISALITRIGYSYQGGIVFYFDRTGQHGLIAATSDEVQLNWVDAINACNDKIIGDYSDWYLPSIDQLYLMYTNIGKGAGASSPNYNIGGFVDGMYLSSTEAGSKVLYQWFSNGGQSNTFKGSVRNVRAIRSF